MQHFRKHHHHYSTLKEHHFIPLLERIGLAKTMLQGIVKGESRQGRQKKRWEDKIREWTGLGFAESQRAVENREKWRKLVVKSSVVPQRPHCS